MYLFKFVVHFKEGWLLDEVVIILSPHEVQGGSNMTGTDCGLFTHKSVLVIFESPCIQETRR
jgi:hypothetical protein